MPIIREARYFGPGLPDQGTPYADIAYREALRAAQHRAVSNFLRGKTWSNGHYVGVKELVEHAGEIHDVVKAAAAAFDAENGELAGAAMRTQPRSAD